jgi:hypothetical protein
VDADLLRELAPDLAAVLGDEAGPRLETAAEIHVESILGEPRKDVREALERAYAVWLQCLLEALREHGGGLGETARWRAPVGELLGDEAAAVELLRTVADGEPPAVAVLREAWEWGDPPPPPPGFHWSEPAGAYRRRAGRGFAQSGEPPLPSSSLSGVREAVALFDEGAGSWQRHEAEAEPENAGDGDGEHGGGAGGGGRAPTRSPRLGGRDAMADRPFGMAPPGDAGAPRASMEPPAPRDLAGADEGGPEEALFGEAAEPPDAEPAAGAEPVARPLQRTPHMDLAPAPPFAPGDRITVEVYADRGPLRPGESGEGVVIHAPAEQERFDLQVWLVGSADHFAIEEALQPLVIERGEARSSTATFTVRVRPDAGAAEGAFLSALFSYQGRACGRVTRTVPLAVPEAAEGEAAERRGGGPPVAAGEGAAESAPAAASAAAADPPGAAAGAEEPRNVLELHPGLAADLLVRVVATSGDGRRFTCRVTTPLLAGWEEGREGDWELPERTDRWVGNVMADFTRPRTSAFVRRVALQGAGEEIFDAAPAVFREVFWALVDDAAALARLRTVAVVSDEPYVPWELMIPSRPRPGAEPEERQPLGVEFVVSRWTAKDHVQPPQRLPLADSWVVAPTDSGLQKAADEARMVRDAFAGELIDPASIEMLDTFLGRGGRSLLHFVCHGTSKEGQQALVMQGKEELRPYFLRGMSNFEKAVRAHRPLVFLNACEVGRLEPGLVGAGGFAEAFMNLGAGGVVAALWSVKDDLAHELAEEFYRRVREEPATPFAAILRDLRRRSYEGTTAEDTWAAYCFYGDPLASAAGDAP